VRKILVSVLAWLLLAAAVPVVAAPVRGLYEASVPVPDQSPQIREQALQQALEAVLVRVTGDRQVSGNPAALPILSRASTLLLGYGYETGSAGQGLQLRAQFDARALEAAVRSQGLPVWGPNRFSHLVWLALRDDGQPRAVLDAKTAATRAGAALSAADQRGLVLLFPELDATERRMASFNEIWTGQYDGVVGASRRYNPDQVLVARVGREGGRWLARWALLDNASVTEEWVSAQSTLEAALAEGLHQLADRAAQRYAVLQGGRSEDLVLQVSGVRSLGDYSRTLNYFRGLNPVRAAQVDRVEGEVVTFRLRVDGDPEMLTRVIAAGRVLRKQDEGFFGSSQSYVLVR
jgi:hypothetical protein